MCLKSLTKVCGEATPPGAKLKAYYSPISEHVTWPQTRAQLVVSPAVPAQGDTKILDEPFDFVDTAGKGFWRSIDVILVDTPSMSNNMTGAVGGQMIVQRYALFIPANDAQTLEWIECLIAQSGCNIWMIPTKDNNHHVIGDLDNGVYIETLEGGSGSNENRLGYNVVVYANNGRATMLYDAEEHGIDITPNPA